ncbi:MAG: protein kinase [Leptolyngbyaceae cyanobacterium MO_188.B28]|nr:protein kinase [Leptolyngbyaceae cyanobacterium MO_188.B28]
MNTLIDQALQGGKYTLDNELEQDDYGVTFRATHHHLGRTVLIKTLSEIAHQSPDFAERKRVFQDDVRRLATCVHPNIVSIYDSFEEEDFPYIVMDFIPGRTLQEVVFPGRPLAEAIAIRYIRQIGAALQVIHQTGLLHRDITPNHIVIHPKTLDAVLTGFGLARNYMSDPIQPETLLINPGGYAALEQYLSPDQLPPATDVYGLAATLYALLTAKAPVHSMLRDQQTLPPPRQLRPELSPAVNRAVMRGLALEHEERPQTVEEWLSLLPGAESVDAIASSGQSMRSRRFPRFRVAMLRRRGRRRSKGTQSSPQLMAGIVPKTGLDKRWLTFSAMVFGGGLSLFAIIALLFKVYLPKSLAPLPANVPNAEEGEVQILQELGIPALKQQSPSSAETSIPGTRGSVLEDPLAQPLQPLIDQAPIPELLLEELIPLPEDLEAAPADGYSEDATGLKDLNREAPVVPADESPSASGQSLETPVLPALEDIIIPSPLSPKETLTPDSVSAPLSESPAPAEGSPETPENPEALPEETENLEVSPDNSGNPEVLPENPE